MATGHHAAACAGVKPGDTVAVVGDGAVGLCVVLASNRFGADRIIALSRHPARHKLAWESGATDIIEERGDAANQAVPQITGTRCPKAQTICAETTPPPNDCDIGHPLACQFAEVDTRFGITT